MTNKEYATETNKIEGAEIPLSLKCNENCIHYGKKYPCVFCVRDKENKDYYKQGS